MRVPQDTLLWYLAVFRRLFVGIEEAAAADDCPAMWLWQQAADVVHNIPHVLRRDGADWGPHTLEGTNRWLAHFPDLVIELSGPRDLVPLATRCVSRYGIYEELGLAPDLSNLDLAPETARVEHLEQVERVCLRTRQSFSWTRMTGLYSERCLARGRENGVIARVAKELPPGLARWQGFDPAAFNLQLEAVAPRAKPSRRARGATPGPDVESGPAAPH